MAFLVVLVYYIAINNKGSSHNIDAAVSLHTPKRRFILESSVTVEISSVVYL